MMRLILSMFAWVLLQNVSAQPGDRPFSVVTFDSYGMAECHPWYKLYACSVQYPNSGLRSDSLELVWKPDLNTIQINEPLVCTTVTDTTDIPFKFCYRASSCLHTNLLMIIRNEKDTMFISTGGADPYAWIVTPGGYEHSVPFIFHFERGLFYLQKLDSDKAGRVLFNSTYRNYFLNIFNSDVTYIPALNEQRISLNTMSKQSYLADDTIAVTLTGRVLNDGGCGSGTILWTLQRFESGEWIIAYDHCCMQMDCGVGPTIADHTSIPVILLKRKVNKTIATYPMQMEMIPGKYRLIVYDDYYQFYRADPFIIN